LAESAYFARKKETSPDAQGCDLAVMATNKTSKRTVIEPHKGDRRYVRRNQDGEFKKEVDVGRSLSADKRQKAKTKVPKGQGDRGDVKR
jgi:hypothetical protein